MCHHTLNFSTRASVVSVLSKHLCVSRCSWVNSVRLSDTYRCLETWPSLLQIMVCHLFCVKPLSEPMLTYCQLDHLAKCSKISIKMEQLPFQENKLRCCLQMLAIWSHDVSHVKIRSCPSIANHFGIFDDEISCCIDENLQWTHFKSCLFLPFSYSLYKVNNNFCIVGNIQIKFGFALLVVKGVLLPGNYCISFFLVCLHATHIWTGVCCLTLEMQVFFIVQLTHWGLQKCRGHHFQVHFPENFSWKFYSNGNGVDTESALVQVMACCQIGNKPLHEPMMTQKFIISANELMWPVFPSACFRV